MVTWSRCCSSALYASLNHYVGNNERLKTLGKSETLSYFTNSVEHRIQRSLLSLERFFARSQLIRLAVVEVVLVSYCSPSSVGQTQVAVWVTDRDGTKADPVVSPGKSVPRIEDDSATLTFPSRLPSAYCWSIYVITETWNHTPAYFPHSSATLLGNFFPL